MNMKKISRLLLIAGLVLCFNDIKASKNSESSNANLITSSVKGQIIDKTSGEALTGVAVKVNGLNEIVYTDFDGYFEIDNIRPGKYELSLNYISYKNLDKTIQVGANKKGALKFEIEPLTK